MSSGDSTCGADADKYATSNQQTATVSQSLNGDWSGPQYHGETRVWTHDNGVVVEVSASAAGASHRDELVWSVIVRPDGRESPGRRITQHHLSSEQGAVERALQYVADHPGGSLPNSSWDEWGVLE